MRKEKSVKRLRLLRMLLVVFLLMNSLWVVAQVKVVDAESGTPVCYASVFDDASGKVLGITTSEGLLPVGATSCPTISVQHINYEPVTVATGSIQGNTIKLTTREAYQVPEVTVTKKNHDYLRVKLYVRQYTIMNGTVAAVSESVNYAFYNAKNSKLKERLTHSRKLMRNEYLFKGQPKLIVKAGAIRGSLPGGDIVRDIKDARKYDDGKRHTLTRPFGHGKFCTYYVKHNSKAKLVEFITDSVCVDKPFNVKIMGIAYSNGYSSSTFSSAYGKPSLSTWKNSIHAARITHNKTKSSVDKYIEIYVLESEYADKEDYKTLKKELEQKAKSGTSTKFVRPEGFPGFNKYVTNAMKNMKVISD